MALIKCEECGKEISDKAKVCVNCGCPITNKKIEMTSSEIGIDLTKENYKSLTKKEQNNLGKLMSKEKCYPYAIALLAITFTIIFVFDLIGFFACVAMGTFPIVSIIILPISLALAIVLTKILNEKNNAYYIELKSKYSK